MDKTSVKTKDINANDTELFLNTPTNRIAQDGQMQYNIKMAELIRSSANSNSKFLTRNQLHDFLKKLSLWTDNDQTLFIRLQLEIRDMESKLRQGGIKLSDGKNIAINISRKRSELLNLYSKRSQFDSTTMESIAENHKFKFLLVKCSVDSNNKQYFNDIEDYENRQNEPASIALAQQLASMMFGYSTDFVNSLPENQWLKQYRFMNSAGELIDEDGNRIDLLGKRVDGNGRWINKDGQFVDINDNIIDEQGNLIVDSKPFLDDKGNPIE